MTIKQKKHMAFFTKLSMGGIVALLLLTFFTFYQLKKNAQYETTAQTAPQATVSFSPQTLTILPNNVFAVGIWEDSGLEPVNAVQANIEFPSNLLSIDSIDYTSSSFSIQAQEAQGIGTLKLARGTTTPVTGNQLVATVRFRTLTTGIATVLFSNTSAVVSSITNQNILNQSLPATYTIALAPSPTPIGDTTPPSVLITNPADKAVLPRSKLVTIAATASDNVKVTRVDFWVNNSLKCSDSTSAYTCNWKVPGKRSSQYFIEARAYDAAGNVSFSRVTVTAQ